MKEFIHNLNFYVLILIKKKTKKKQSSSETKEGLEKKTIDLQKNERFCITGYKGILL
jgi:hypothetical protein